MDAHASAVPASGRFTFSKSFWIANTLELFERLAFYGTTAVLAVFLSEKVGLGKYGGTLAGWFSSLLYGLAIFAGIIVDRYGYRRSLILCFAMFAVGYSAIGVAGMDGAKDLLASTGKLPYVVAALAFTAVGGSLIKPCIVGTVAHTTDEGSRSLGYSIYYTLVNIGGFLGPNLAQFVRKSLGIEYVLLVSSATSLLLFVSTLLFFREPHKVEGEVGKTLSQVLRDFVTVLRNGRFMLFLLIFSGFYIMFWQIFLLLPFYLKDALHYDHFEFMESIDAFAVILLPIVLTALTKRLPPILTMAAGFAVASFSWLLIARAQGPILVAAALVVFAMGETLQAPRYYEYVASLAPKDQAGTYMGFAFLPVAIGAFVAGGMADYLRAQYLNSPHPAAMWPAVATVGFVSTLLLVAYDRILHRN